MGGAVGVAKGFAQLEQRVSLLKVLQAAMEGRSLTGRATGQIVGMITESDIFRRFVEMAA